MLPPMAQSDSPLDALWMDYRRAFQDWDDLTLARWLAQTLGQLQGKAWRMSHPLLGAYRLAAQVGHDRQIWFKRMATPPAAYSESPCCRAPMLPLLTRDVRESGLICLHCDDPMLPFDELPSELQESLSAWAQEYAPVHAVAHWEDSRRAAAADYNKVIEEAAQTAEGLLARAGSELVSLILEHYPTIVWEDQDECLEVRPEDVKF